MQVRQQQQKQDSTTLKGTEGVLRNIDREGAKGFPILNRKAKVRVPEKIIVFRDCHVR